MLARKMLTNSGVSCTKPCLVASRIRVEFYPHESSSGLNWRGSCASTEFPQFLRICVVSVSNFNVVAQAELGNSTSFQQKHLKNQLYFITFWSFNYPSASSAAWVAERVVWRSKISRLSFERYTSCTARS